MNISLHSGGKKSDASSALVPALIIIDTQNAYLKEIPSGISTLALHYINLLIQLFRKHKFTTIRIYHYDKDSGPKPGSEDFKFPGSIQILPEDTEIIKAYSDAFNKTNLGNVLKSKGCNTFFLCGLNAVFCVLATRFGAQNNDYKAFLVRNAIMSHNMLYTKHIEEMYRAISYEEVKLLLMDPETSI